MGDVKKFEELLEKVIATSKGLGFCLSVKDTNNIIKTIDSYKQELIKMYENENKDRKFYEGQYADLYNRVIIMKVIKR